jgi:hypothetical protein
LAVALALVALVGCSSSTSNESPETQSTGTSTIPPVTTAPPSTPSTSTSAGGTTIAPSAGWQPIDLTGIDAQIAPPCCASDWYGTPSPALPADGAPLLDGDYFVRIEWPADPTQPLELHLYRFESCSALPEGTCEDPSDPTAMGIDETTYSKLIVPLDANVRVVLTGFSGADTMATAAQGTGTDLGEIAAAVEDAYAQVFIARAGAGESADAIIADVRAHPVAGFGPADDGSSQSVQFEYGGAPPLLFQAPFEYTEPPTPGRGTDVLRITSVGVRDGAMTLYVYAGFYS